MQKITPHLWYDTQAENAVNFYVSIFPHSKVLTTTHYTETGAKMSGQPIGGVMNISFELNGQKFMAINAGPIFKFNESISFMIHCKDQAEIDYYWDKLTADGGMEQPCGWVKDKFGLSWQVVPEALADIMKNTPPEKIERIMQVMMTMKKLNIAALQGA